MGDPGAMSEFIQIMRFHTDHIDEVQKLVRQYGADVAGRSTFTNEVSGRDLDSGEHVVIVRFPSRAAAEENNALPETGALAHGISELCTGGMSFSNVEVLDV